MLVLKLFMLTDHGLKRVLPFGLMGCANVKDPVLLIMLQIIKMIQQKQSKGEVKRKMF